MATGNLTLQWNVSGGPDGARTGGPVTITTPSAVSETLPVALSVGANTVTVPTGSTWAVILPPNFTVPGVATPNPAYGGTLTLKGVSGDSATLTMSNKFPMMLSWDTSIASFVINATATGSLTVVFA